MASSFATQRVRTNGSDIRDLSAFIAPRIKMALNKGVDGQIDHDIFKSDIFSAGLCLLEAGSFG